MIDPKTKLFGYKSIDDKLYLAKLPEFIEVFKIGSFKSIIKEVPLSFKHSKRIIEFKDLYTLKQSIESFRNKLMNLKEFNAFHIGMISFICYEFFNDDFRFIINDSDLTILTTESRCNFVRVNEKFVISKYMLNFLFRRIIEDKLYRFFKKRVKIVDNTLYHYEKIVVNDKFRDFIFYKTKSMLEFIDSLIHIERVRGPDDPNMDVYDRNFRQSVLASLAIQDNNLYNKVIVLPDASSNYGYEITLKPHILDLVFHIKRRKKSTLLSNMMSEI
jgi:hypothetical protein